MVGMAPSPPPHQTSLPLPLALPLPHFIAHPLQTHMLPGPDELDSDILSTMQCLQCFRDRIALVRELLSPKYHTQIAAPDFLFPSSRLLYTLLYIFLFLFLFLFLFHPIARYLASTLQFALLCRPLTPHPHANT